MPQLLCPVLIGRAAELEVLRSALAAAEAGRGGVVFVTGEAGIGKSRLTAALTGEALAVGAVVLSGRAVPGGGSVPYRPLSEALLQGLRGRSLPADPGLAPWLPALRAVLPTIEAGGDDRHGELSAAVRGEAVLQLLRHLAAGTVGTAGTVGAAGTAGTVGAAGTAGTVGTAGSAGTVGTAGSAGTVGTAALVLVLEDLHWADPDTLAVLEYLSDNLSGEQVLCVCTCREETASETPSAGNDLVTRLAARRAASVLALTRLSADETAAMVRACLPSAGADLVVGVQRVAEGVPFLVEESLVAPGVPRSFADGVRSRLAGLGSDERLVLDTAALLGRQFDWRLLPAATGLDAGVVNAALERGVRARLLAFDAGAFRFRHMLTREALLSELLPTRRAAIAARALSALDALTAPDTGDLKADLAVDAGHPDQAGRLLTTSGRDALRRGALATAIGTLRRAAALLSDAGQRAAAEVLLVESLALAGRVDEATAIGDRLVLQMPDGGQAHARTVVHLKLAHAAVDGTRWADARRQLGIVADLLAAGPDAAGPDAAGAAAPDAGLAAETAVLNAEVAFADSDLALAERLSAAALAQPEASAEVRCHAHELLGRLRRGRSLDAARASFERALATAEAAGLAVWRLRALHELGTIDMFDNAGAARLSQARQIAGELGAASTGAVIDVQLTACAMFRFDLVEADLHARAALEISARLRLAKTHAIALLFLGEVSALRRDRAAMDHFLAVAQAAEPDDPEIEGSALAGARGMLALLEDDQPTALEYLRRGVALLDSLPQQGPAPYRALWPLLLAATADPDALAAISHARGIGLPVNRVNRGLLGYADAILAGRSGQQDLATRLADAADGELRNYPVWADLARLYAAGPALADDWGQPRHWLVAADGTFSAHGIEPLAARCRRLLSAPPRSSWARLGITERQADVLRLVADGSSNKEIAARLHLSARTVEKHVEALLRLTGARSRTQLVARAGLEYPD